MNEVVLLRVVVTVLLLVYHSICFFRGSWEVPFPYTNVDVKAYSLIANLSYSIMLEGFTFVSGYVYASQVLLKGKFKFTVLFEKKIKRLIIPALAWGGIYMLLFSEYQDVSYQGIVFKLFNGVHHFWFLPMLFFCFLFFQLLEKFMSINFILLLSFFLIIIKYFFFIPFGIGHSFQYLYYFSLGVFIYRNKEYVKRKLVRFNLFFLFLFLFLLLFSLYHYVELTKVSVISKIIHFIEARFFKTFGLIALFIGVNLYLKNRKELKKVTYSIGVFSMGIYVFHQMILDFMYYHTPLPIYINEYFLPLVGFVTAFVFSVLFTYLGKKIILLKDII